MIRRAFLTIGASVIAGCGGVRSATSSRPTDGSTDDGGSNRPTPVGDTDTPVDVSILSVGEWARFRDFGFAVTGWKERSSHLWIPVRVTYIGPSDSGNYSNPINYFRVLSNGEEIGTVWAAPSNVTPPAGVDIYHGDLDRGQTITAHRVVSMDEFDGRSIDGVGLGRMGRPTKYVWRAE